MSTWAPGSARRHAFGDRPHAGIVAQLVAEIFKMLFSEPPFNEGASVDAGRGVSLEIDEVAGLVADRGAEKVVVADLE